MLLKPTNYLDIETIIWLENFLKSYSSAVVIVSHDKMFLDNVTNRTIEISLGRIGDYDKSYSKFLELVLKIQNNKLLHKRTNKSK